MQGLGVKQGLGVREKLKTKSVGSQYMHYFLNP
jgi:hypothetical protein